MTIEVAGEDKINSSVGQASERREQERWCECGVRLKRTFFSLIIMGHAFEDERGIIHFSEKDKLSIYMMY